MIKGEKIILCAIKKEDAELIYQWVNNPYLRQYTGTIYPVSEYEHEEWIENISKSKDTKLLVIKYQGKSIGTIGLKNFNYIDRKVEIFISIGDSSNYGKGLGADAVKTLTNYSFNRLNMHKVYLHVFSNNKRAIECYKKVGYVINGVLPDDHFNNGKYSDVVIMSIINKNSEEIKNV